MNFVVRPLYNNANLLMILLFTAIVIASGILMRVAGNKRTETSHFEATGGEPNCSTLNATEAEPRKKPRRKEYLFRLLTNTTRSLIQMEIKARRLEENMRRIKERTVNLLWKNKDKALWRILFKNISKHIAIRHEFHQHSSLDRILHDRPAYRGSGGPGYATPMDAYLHGKRETLLYTVCVQPDKTKQDYLATLDVDPSSPTYSQVIYRTYTGSVGDELHHSGWNVCSSCHDDAALKRDKLVLPSLHSAKVFFIDVGKDPRKPELHKVIDGSEMRSVNCAYPHTAHCLASGEIMISTMGDNEGNAKGDFVLVDAKAMKVTGTWTKGDKVPKFGYDFWYQPYHDVMISTEWGKPKIFSRGFQPSDIEDPDVYGSSLNIFKWSTRELQQTIPLGMEGTAPLEIRFLHDPKAAQGYVGCAVFANVFRFFKKEDGTWGAKKVIDIPSKRVAKEETEFDLNGLMSDILLSLDDRYMYLSNWLHGDVRQYDISDPERPRLVAQIFLGGRIVEEELRLVDDKELKEAPTPVTVRGKRLHGAPQMLQLSLDGRRLYVSCSLYSPWDKQFYPTMVQKGTTFRAKNVPRWPPLDTGAHLKMSLTFLARNVVPCTNKTGGWVVKLDVDQERGGLKLDPDFLVDFGTEPDGPVMPHEMRYPGGDCSSDIWLADK